MNYNNNKINKVYYGDNEIVTTKIVENVISNWTLPNNIKFADGNYTLTELHFDNLTNCSGMFRECTSLKSVPLFDTSKVTDMSNMFYNCYSLTSIPEFDTSSCEDMEYAFYDVEVTTLPKFDTSKVKYIRGFIGSSGIVTLPELDFGSVIAASGDVYYVFTSCYKLTNVGGFKDLGKSFYIGNGAATLDFTDCSKLSYESCLNIFNSIYDLTTTAYTSTAKIRFSATTFALLSEADKKIAADKGWIVESA